MEPYALPGNQGLTVRLPVAEGSWYYVILRYAATRGFRMLLGIKDKAYDRTLRQQWQASVSESVSYVGSDVNGSNQINGLVRFYIHPSWLSDSDSDVEVLWRENTLSLSVRTLDLVYSPLGSVGPRMLDRSPSKGYRLEG